MFFCFVFLLPFSDSSHLALIPLLLLPNLFTSSALLMPVSPAGSDAIYLLAPCWVPIWGTGGEVEPSCSQEPLGKKMECEYMMYFYIKRSLSLCLYDGMRSSLGTYTHQQGSLFFNISLYHLHAYEQEGLCECWPAGFFPCPQ